MRRAVILCSALGLASSLLAGPSPAAALERVSVAVPAHPSVTGHIQISFHPNTRLPHGGYYYAVLILIHYGGASLVSPPGCAVSSNMQETEYGYPRTGKPVRLTLLATKSLANAWCAGGTYEGAIYAVPHRPPCTGSYPCYGKSTQVGACWELEGQHVCGVVAKPEPEPKPPPPEPTPKHEPSPQPLPYPPQPPPAPYSFPGGLPQPVDHTAHIVGRFRVEF